MTVTANASAILTSIEIAWHSTQFRLTVGSVCNREWPLAGVAQLGSRCRQFAERGGGCGGKANAALSLALQFRELTEPSHQHITEMVFNMYK